MKITFISDTHTKHKQVTSSLPGGDLLIHAGDLSSMGYKHEIQQFCKWFNSIEGYNHKAFIAGNHDWGFQDNHEQIMEVVNSYKDIDYLQDDMLMIGEDYDKMVKIWGSPWQPEFYNWAFNLPRQGDELKEKWNMIPEDTDVLITHSPPNGYGDLVNNWKQPNTHVGCECLISRIGEINPLVNVFGHIHEGYGVQYGGKTLFVNASICTTEYEPTNKPIVIDLVEINGKINAIYVEE